jgi:outer membrane immunogenic protein
MKLTHLASVCATALVAFVSPLHAADMPARVAKAPAMVAAPIFDWSGFYVGAQAGYLWGESNFVSDGDAFPFDIRGGLAGLHIGGQWQNGLWVLGWEADGNWSGADGDDGGAGGLLDALEIRAEGSVRARLGYASNNWLVYLTGGWAWANIEHDRATIGNFTDTLSGWTVGAGLAVAPAPNFFWTLEYRYSDYGSTSGQPGTDLLELDPRAHQVTVRASWKFATGKAPVAAPIVTKN